MNSKIFANVLKKIVESGNTSKVLDRLFVKEFESKDVLPRLLRLHPEIKKEIATDIKPVKIIDKLEHNIGGYYSPSEMLAYISKDGDMTLKAIHERGHAQRHNVVRATDNKEAFAKLKKHPELVNSDEEYLQGLLSGTNSKEKSLLSAAYGSPEINSLKVDAPVHTHYNVFPEAFYDEAALMNRTVRSNIAKDYGLYGDDLDIIIDSMSPEELKHYFRTEGSGYTKALLEHEQSKSLNEFVDEFLNTENFPIDFAEGLMEKQASGIPLTEKEIKTVNAFKSALRGYDKANPLKNIDAKKAALMGVASTLPFVFLPLTSYYKKGGKPKIHIKKENRGKFTSYCGGKVTDACIAKAKASGNPKLIKRATFAANARKWKH